MFILENFIALANRIVDLREQRGFSQTELAKRLGVSKSTMSKIELGNRRLSTDELSKIASIFDVSTDYLLGRSKSGVHDPENVDLDSDPVVLSYGGKPVSDEDMEIIKAILARHQKKEGQH
ncbi:helix-turn-helix domain-containing protein [Limosilactobacillus fermentum]|uniref:helix-turn-helix domain-containing protein n=1 Tax=Limosilactobacillus fermentum TaxID=1613 RepID=UPI0030F47F23